MTDPALQRALHTLTAAEFLELAGLTEVFVGVRGLRHDLAIAIRYLQRIERAVKAEGVSMSQINDRLDQLAEHVNGVAADIQADLAEIAGQLAGNLTPEQQDKFTSLDAKLDGLKAAVDNATPEPGAAPTPEPEPGV